MAPTILLTRAEEAAAEFADRIRERLGHDTKIVLSPLMSIEPVSDQPQDLDHFASIVFTSRNAVNAFAIRTPRRDWPCFCVGDATAAAATAAGFAAVSAGGTANDLAALLVANPPPTPCLYARGDHVASDLFQRLNSAGIETIEAVLYHQKPVDLTAEAKAILNRENPVVLPLFSPRSARLFFNQDTGIAPLWVPVISAKTADCVPTDRVHKMHIAAAPSALAMLDALAGLFDAAKRVEGDPTAQ